MRHYAACSGKANKTCYNCYACEGSNCYYKQLKRLEQENKELKAYKDVNEDFKKAWDELNKKYTEVLKLAKENADSNEYCLQELEQKVEQYSSALNTIQRMVLSAWEQGKYLDGGLYNDLINEFAKINEEIGRASCRERV